MPTTEVWSCAKTTVVLYQVVYYQAMHVVVRLMSMIAQQLLQNMW